MRIVLIQLSGSLGLLALLVGMDEWLDWALRRAARRREIAGVIGSAGLSATPGSREALAAACRGGMRT